MKDKTRIVLQPEYMKEFKCIGHECEDSCCIGWRVDLDKETYLKYKKVQNAELKPILSKMINRKHNQKSNESYGKIKMNKDGCCPLLDEQKMCKIHGILGEEYLSDTCTFYPRMLRKIDGKYERSATMSCPEISRLALLNPKGICLEHIDEDEKKIFKINSNFDTEGHLFLNKSQRYFWDIRIFSISLLQNRNYSLEERLIMLGITYKKIEELQENKQVQNIPNLLANMEEFIQDGILKDDLNKVPTNIQLQMRLAKEMTDERLAQGITSERYIQCLRETLIGIDCIDEVKYDIMSEKYKENYIEYVIPYLKEKEYILENYLVNEYFKEQMPFGSYKSIWDSYIFICVLYGMIKLHIIGLAGYNKGIDDKIVLKLIQSFSKVILHDSNYIQNMIKLIKSNGYDSLAYMSILVKN